MSWRENMGYPHKRYPGRKAKERIIETLPAETTDTQAENRLRMWRRQVVADGLSEAGGVAIRSGPHGVLYIVAGPHSK